MTMATEPAAPQPEETDEGQAPRFSWGDLKEGRVVYDTTCDRRYPILDIHGDHSVLLQGQDGPFAVKRPGLEAQFARGEAEIRYPAAGGDDEASADGAESDSSAAVGEESR